jgi:hypothetical protein
MKVVSSCCWAMKARAFASKSGSMRLSGGAMSFWPMRPS